ncbi:neuronal pentraxin-2-like, partial [Scleropages formosus]
TPGLGPLLAEGDNDGLTASAPYPSLPSRSQSSHTPLTSNLTIPPPSPQPPHPLHLEHPVACYSAIPSTMCPQHLHIRHGTTSRTLAYGDKFNTVMVAIIVALLLCASAPGGGRTALGQDTRGTRFLCTAIPAGADPSCPVPAVPMQSSGAPEEDLKSTVMQLRETILQQKETIVDQVGTIKELTSKLSRCESAAEDSLRGGKYRSQGSWRKENSNTMGDLPRDPGDTIDHLGKTMQSLKDRLENLELRDLLQRRLEDLENQLLKKVTELEEEKTQLYNETAAHRHRTESTLNSLLERITELEKEMYAFTVCMWLKSTASPGIGTPFSYGVPGQANEIVLIEWGNNPIELLINDKVAQLPLSVSDGQWHHICITWTTRDGLWEAYQDGEKLGSGENLAPWHPIKPGGVIILGQEQDTVGGRFDATQAFVGELTHFNMWDRVLRPVDIMNMANCSSYMPGNVVPWVDNNVEVFGGATKWALEIYYGLARIAEILAGTHFASSNEEAQAAEVRCFSLVCEALLKEPGRGAPVGSLATKSTDAIRAERAQQAGGAHSHLFENGDGRRAISH